MALNGKILQKALSRYESDKQNRELGAEQRLLEIYARIPRIREIDQELRSSMVDTLGFALKTSSDPSLAIEDIRDQNLALQMERASLLKRNGYSKDYTDCRPACAICEDKGFMGSRPCQCLMRYYKDEQNRQLGGILNISDADFDKFNLDYYSSALDMSQGSSPREAMEVTYEYALQYARNFGKGSSNLFFTGGTGLGKTFLSACIAKVVAEKGFFVCYDTAVNIFSVFENEKFSKNMDSDLDSEKYLDCDLLIFDDLGTELVSSFVVSTLYTIINSRLISRKKTIINTNLSAKDLNERYSPQILSRLRGEYETFVFFGKDIRVIKKLRTN